MENWWNNTDMVQQEYWGGGELFHCQFFHHKSHIDWAGIEHHDLHGERTVTKTELHLNTQSVPRSKHTPSVL